jgi:hypothetical protein
MVMMMRLVLWQLVHTYVGVFKEEKTTLNTRGHPNIWKREVHPLISTAGTSSGANLH